MHIYRRGLSYRLGALALGFVFVAAAGAQDRIGDAEKYVYTEADLDHVRPQEPNPYLSFLPADAEPDWAYWRARMRLEGRRRAARQAAIPKALPVFDETEPPDSRGWNDEQASAEWIDGFGTGDGALREMDVAGTLGPPAPVLLGVLSEEGGEDDGAIPLANQTGLVPGMRVRAHAYIGDGLHGSLGTKHGDFDVFRIDDLRPGQVVTVDIDTPEDASPRLDTKVALYDSTGAIVDLNDDGFNEYPDSYLEVVIEAPGDYFVFVRGVNSFWPGDPFDPDSGPKDGSEGAYTITIGLDANDVDFFSFDLQAGDVLGVTVEGEARKLTLFDPAGVERMGADLDGSFLYPVDTSLPVGGNANVAFVAGSAGRYAVAVERGDGAYTLALRVFRPFLEGQRTFQTLFLDFDGAVYDAQTIFGGNPAADLSPLASFLGNVGLDPTPGGADEHAVIDAILATVEENLIDDIHRFGDNPDYHVQLLNSRDHPDPFGAPNVSRIIIGGNSDELGFTTVGIAESVDVGNFVTSETALVLLDLLTEPGTVSSLHQVALDAEATIIDLMGTALGNIVSHEAGHLFANFHTGHPESMVNLMDGNPNLLDFVGIGQDDVFGSGDEEDIDFGPARFHVYEGFTGLEDTRNAIAFGLPGLRTPVAAEPPLPGVPEVFELSVPYPNPSRAQARFTLRLGRAQAVSLAVYDLLGRRVRLLHEGWLPAGQAHVFTLEADGLPSGLYLIRATGASVHAARPVTLVR